MSQTFSASQLRAARALLNWSRADLAEQSGVSEPTIHRFENNAGEPEVRTRKKLYNVLTEAGVVFTERGVAHANDQIRILEGENVFSRLLDDVIVLSKDTPKPEALFACVDDKVSPPAVVENYRRLRKAEIEMRSLVKAENTYLMGDLKEYRYLPEQFFHNNATVIYGNSFATMILDPKTGADVSAVIIRNPHVAAAQRNLFNLIWANSKKPTETTAKIRYKE